VSSLACSLGKAMKKATTAVTSMAAVGVVGEVVKSGWWAARALAAAVVMDGELMEDPMAAALMEAAKTRLAV